MSKCLHPEMERGGSGMSHDAPVTSREFSIACSLLFLDMIRLPGGAYEETLRCRWAEMRSRNKGVA